MGSASSSRTVQRLLGDNALEGSSICSIDGDNVNFLVTSKKHQNFQKFCSQLQIVDNPQEIIKKYTEHTTELFAKVNLALASDSKVLETHGDYISKLRNSIFSQPFFDDCLLYRGVDFSAEEIGHMENLNSFFIPSFTSTSIDPHKAFSKSATLVIKAPFATQYACSITPALSNYYNEEREVLLSCYTAFRLERIESERNKKIISLYVDEQLGAMNNIDFEYSYY